MAAAVHPAYIHFSAGIQGAVLSAAMTRIFRKIERLSKSSVIILSFSVLAMVGMGDYLTGSETSVGIFYIIPVALASWFVSRQSGLMVSFVSAIVWYLADFFNAPHYSHSLVPVWNALVMLGIFAGAALTLSALRDSNVRSAMLAREIQTGFLPKEMPMVPGLVITSAWLPASVVSGDFFDVLRPNDTHLAFCIADVSGHGVHAALLMSHFQAAFRLLVTTDASPYALCNRINEFVIANTGPENFITFFYGLLDVKTRVLVYTNAGHQRPIVARADGSMIELAEGGIPLGMFPQFPYERGEITLAPSDLLVMWTDGVVELRDGTEEMFGVQRLTSLVRRHRHGGAAGVRDGIMNAVAEFGDNILEDDVTLLVVSISPGGDTTNAVQSHAATA